MDSATSRGTVRFGDFEFDADAGELRKNGAKVRLQEQPLQVLQVLLARPGNVISRDELQKQIWPSDTLCAFFADIVALDRAVGLICEGYFDGHDVLFSDSRGELTSAYEKAELLVAGYNCFAGENGKEVIDADALDRNPSRKVDGHLNEWVMLSQSKVLAAHGEVFEARDKVFTLLKSDNAVAHR